MTTLTTHDPSGLEDLLADLVGAGVFSAAQADELWATLAAAEPRSLPPVPGPGPAAGSVDVYQLFRAASRIPRPTALAPTDSGLPSFGGTLATILAGTISDPTERAIRAIGDQFGELYR